MSKKTVEHENKIKIKKKLIELYFVQTNTYLIMHKSTGFYSTYTKGKFTKKGEKIKALQDWQIYNHLDGKHTLGAKSGQYMNIFLAFDVDFPNLQTAKWITQKISATLDDMRIEHHISFSGGKGYHIEIFFEDIVPNGIHRNLFDYVLDKADVRQFFKDNKAKITTMKLDSGSIIDLGDVEYRPSAGYGIKLPLGYHQRTNNFCGFCDKLDGLRVMDAAESYAYLLKIKRINCKELVEDYFPELVTYTNIQQVITKEKFMKTEGTISQYNPPKYNLSEEEAIDEAVDLLTNGLRYKNSRHNSIFKIAKLLKYYGIEEDEAARKLSDWMNIQPKALYKATIQEARTDIIKTVHDVYAGDYLIKPPEKDIAVTYQEIVAIMNSCPKETQKLLMYAILIHSKRYATKQGVFYFSQPKMAELTGLGLRTVKTTLPLLEELGVLEYVKRNQKFDWTIEKRPTNEYRVMLKLDPSIVDGKVYITDRQDDFNKCLLTFFTLDELKKRIPRRHADKLKTMDKV